MTPSATVSSTTIGLEITTTYVHASFQIQTFNWLSEWSLQAYSVTMETFTLLPFGHFSSLLLLQLPCKNPSTLRTTHILTLLFLCAYSAYFSTIPTATTKSTFISSTTTTFFFVFGKPHSFYNRINLSFYLVSLIWLHTVLPTSVSDLRRSPTESLAPYLPFSRNPGLPFNFFLFESGGERFKSLYNCI